MTNLPPLPRAFPLLAALVAAVLCTAAACAGAIQRPSRLIATVGSPMPVTPLTAPARRKTERMGRRWRVGIRRW